MPTSSKKKTNYRIRFGHSLWSVNQLLAQEVKWVLLYQVCSFPRISELKIRTERESIVLESQSPVEQEDNTKKEIGGEIDSIVFLRLVC
ncbi:hypothetical protein WN51_09120 [Melipona quadrifasciata]|uniref:Uncharacterized protein n=1 Tax=Melipona quadrifasciata TaxID=166423 RepID=A0A0N0BJL4_9HYME|nr:hypothetical protein WN51_09120 [Melipona quadrifasciata]